MFIQTITRTNLNELPSFAEPFGFGDLPTEPMQVGQWWVVPAQLYHSTIPPEGMRRVSALVNSGVRIKGLVIADDIRNVKATEKKPQVNKEQAMQVGRAFGSMIGVLITITGAVLMGVLMAVGAALAYDPVLIAVLESGEWVSVYSWYD